jgi:multidrug efflux pump subunit AcrA (membrane-fusion protein)
MKENKVLIVGVLVAVLIVVSALGYKKFSNNSSSALDMEHVENNYPKVSVLTVGQSSTPENSLDIGSGISWSGEILSANDVNIQPKREGTIAEWNIKIGQKVYQGQTLGRLSPPPKTSDVVQAIASQAESLARAKAEAEASKSYIEKKMLQLNSQNQTNPLIESKKEAIISVIQKSLAWTYQELFQKENVAAGMVNWNPTIGTKFRVYSQLGILDNTTKEAYPKEVYLLLDDLKKPNYLPEKNATEYFDLTLKLISTTPPDMESGQFTNDKLKNLRSEASVYRAEFLSAMQEYQSALQDKDTQVFQLEKDLALANAEVIAKQASYNTVVGGLTGGLEIVATRSGTISTIAKRVGEFVRPEDTLASINGTSNNEKLIRFRIPSNALAPKSGDILTVVRPGFLDTKIKIKVIGVGVSLDTNGSYMADAQFVAPTDWPVHASVRVIPSNTTTTTAIIPFTAIFWSDDGATRVWTVTFENKLLSKEITAGRTFGDTVEVTTGLINGDRVVTRPIPDMKDGLQVEASDNAIPLQTAPSDKKAEVHDESKPHSHDE